MEFFEFFDLEIQFYPDISKLARQFKANTMANHPDLNEGSDDAELLTAQNNKAFTVLKNERKRIQYILQYHNANLEKEALDPMFLMEMMELNESLAEAKMAEKDMEPSLQEVRDRDQSIWAQIADLGKKHDEGQLTIEQASKSINRLYLQSNYMQRILENHGI